MRPGSALLVCGLCYYLTRSQCQSSTTPTPSHTHASPLATSPTSLTEATPSPMVLPPINTTSPSTTTSSIELLLTVFSLTYIAAGGLGLLLILTGVLCMIALKCKRRGRKRKVFLIQTDLTPLDHEQPPVSELYNRTELELSHQQSFVNSKNESEETAPRARGEQNEYIVNQPVETRVRVTTSENVAYGLISPTHTHEEEEDIYDNETAEQAFSDEENIYDNDLPAPTSPVVVNPHASLATGTEEEEEYETVDNWRKASLARKPSNGREDNIYDNDVPEANDGEEENIYDNEVPISEAINEEIESEYLDMMAVNPHPSTDDVEEDIYDN